MSKIAFFDSYDSATAFAITIRTGVQSRSELFDELQSKLRFPYFGRNWNALSDLLRDLSWIIEREVVIIHHELPQLDNDSLELYFDVLFEAISDWKPSEAHELKAIFPFTARSYVTQFISQHNPSFTFLLD